MTPCTIGTLCIAVIAISLLVSPWAAMPLLSFMVVSVIGNLLVGDDEEEEESDEQHA